MLDFNFYNFWDISRSVSRLQQSALISSSLFFCDSDRGGRPLPISPTLSP